MESHGRIPMCASVFAEVVKTLDGTDAILVVGPSLAKLELSQYMIDHAAVAAAKVVGIESADHPTSGQIIASARRYFRATDRMAGQHTISG